MMMSRSPQPTLVVLAAGVGSRYGGLKQLTPVGPGGETLLEYAAFDALRAGFGRVVLVVREETERLFRERLDKRLGRHVRVDYVQQSLADLPAGATPPAGRSKPWGTGHALLTAGTVVDEQFVVVNADDYYGVDAYGAVAAFLGDVVVGPPSVAVVGFPVASTLSTSGPVSRALIQRDHDRLLGLLELPSVQRDGDRIVFRRTDGQTGRLRSDDLVSMNMWGVSAGVLPELRLAFDRFFRDDGTLPGAEFLLPDAIGALLRSGRIAGRVLQAHGEWCGLTFRGDARRTTRLLASLVDAGRYPHRLWE